MKSSIFSNDFCRAAESIKSNFGSFSKENNLIYSNYFRKLDPAIYKSRHWPQMVFILFTATESGRKVNRMHSLPICFWHWYSIGFLFRGIFLRCIFRWPTTTQWVIFLHIGPFLLFTTFWRPASATFRRRCIRFWKSCRCRPLCRLNELPKKWYFLHLFVDCDEGRCV